MAEPDPIADAILAEFLDLTEPEAAGFATQIRSLIKRRLRQRGDWFLEELTRLRVDAGFSIPQLAEQLDWSTSKVARATGGDAVLSKTDLTALLTACGAPPDVSAALHEEAAKRRQTRPTESRPPRSRLWPSSNG